MLANTSVAAATLHSIASTPVTRPLGAAYKLEMRVNAHCNEVSEKSAAIFDSVCWESPAGSSPKIRLQFLFTIAADIIYALHAS
jgi:hypothetical protein